MDSVVAEHAREAPPEVTLIRRAGLRDAGATIHIYSFPETDHCMVEFNQAPDGTGTYRRIADGDFQRLADWNRGDAAGSYGRIRRR